MKDVRACPFRIYPYGYKITSFQEILDRKMNISCMTSKISSLMDREMKGEELEEVLIKGARMLRKDNNP